MYILSGYTEQKAYCPADYKYAASGSDSCHNLLIEDSLIGYCAARWNCLFLLVFYFYIYFSCMGFLFLSIIIAILCVSFCLFDFFPSFLSFSCRQFKPFSRFQTLLGVWVCVLTNNSFLLRWFVTFFYSFGLVWFGSGASSPLHLNRFDESPSLFYMIYWERSGSIRSAGLWLWADKMLFWTGKWERNKWAKQTKENVWHFKWRMKQIKKNREKKNSSSHRSSSSSSTHQNRIEKKQSSRKKITNNHTR